MSRCQESRPSSRSRSKTAIITHVIAASSGRKGHVTGLTVQGDELVIVCWRRRLIEVYNATSFAFQRNIEVKEPIASRGAKTRATDFWGFFRTDVCQTVDIGGLASCDVNKCLYVSDGCNELIYRVELTADNDQVFVWRVAGGGSPRCLSVNGQHNLVVTCDSPSPPRKLMEYTTRGQLERDICLQVDVMFPHHAVLLDSGHFVVSHSCLDNSLHRVCLVDANGKVLLSYGDRSDAGMGPLNDPQQLAVARNGFIYAANCDNNEIVVLDSKLKRSHDLRIGGGDVRQPFSLYLDEQRDLLFVGECNDERSRVVVLKL